MRTRTVTIWASRTRTPAAWGASVAETWNEASRPSTETGSVRIWFIRVRVLAGPTTRACRGSTVTSSTRVPAAGAPTTSATIGRVLSAIASSTTRISGGVMAMTSTSRGTLMSSLSRT